MAALAAEPSDGESGGDDDAEPTVEALSKRAAKKQRKREQSVAEVVADTPIASGIGHKLLMQMGWSGTGTPLQPGGIAEPVRAVGSGAKHQGLAAEDEELLAATEASLAAEAAKTSAESVGSKRRRQPDRLQDMLSQTGPQLEAPTTWCVTLQMSKPSDEVTVREVLAKARGFTVLRAAPVFD